MLVPESTIHATDSFYTTPVLNKSLQFASFDHASFVGGLTHTSGQTLPYVPEAVPTQLIGFDASNSLLYGDGLAWGDFDKAFSGSPNLDFCGLVSARQRISEMRWLP